MPCDTRSKSDEGGFSRFPRGTAYENEPLIEKHLKSPLPREIENKHTPPRMFSEERASLATYYTGCFLQMQMFCDKKFEISTTVWGGVCRPCDTSLFFLSLRLLARTFVDGFTQINNPFA